MNAMERSEPSLAPQWLRTGTAGSSSSSSTGHSNQHLGLSSHTDRVFGSAFRNRLFASASDHDINRGASSLKRTSSSNSRRSSSTNGSVAHDTDSPTRRPYSSFGRSYRDRDREKDYNRHKKERVLDDGLDDIFDDFISGRDEKGNLLRSQSMIARRQNDSFPKKVGADSSGVLQSVGGAASSINKSSFDRDFPSLGSDERQSSHEIGRIPSPGPGMASASILVGNSIAIRGEGWTSALAAVPASSLGNGATHAPAHPSSSASTVSSISTANNGLNMAETLAQTPLRARVVPELSVETQRLEELAIKQSRQLIPVTPSTSKNMVLNSSDKLKTKVVRSGDASLIPKVVSQMPSKNPQIGNFQVLNRDRNCLLANSKETPNPTNPVRVSNVVGALPSGELPSKPGNAKPRPEMKPRVNSMIQNGPSEKRPTPRSQDRTDFFNSLRKKVNSNHVNACQEKDTVLSTEKTDEQMATAIISDGQQESSAHSDPVNSDTHTVNQNGNCGECKESKLCSSDAFDDDTLYSIPTEEEFKFLRELGWKEDERVEHITEEEIELFRSKHMSKVPSSALCPSVSQQ